jgi:hypothetical protein
MVLAGVSGYTRVCAYDRPGTVTRLKDNVRPSRSDAVPEQSPQLQCRSGLRPGSCGQFSDKVAVDGLLLLFSACRGALVQTVLDRTT